MSWSQQPLPSMSPVENARMISRTFSGLQEFEINTAEWNHLASARFGEARVAWRDKEGNPMTKWEGDCYRYDIFRKEDRYALRWWNGSGEGWLISMDNERREECNLLAHIVTLESESQRWDFCHFVWEAASLSFERGAKTTRERIFDLLLKGKLKKRTKNGQPYVKVEM